MSPRGHQSVKAAISLWSALYPAVERNGVLAQQYVKHSEMSAWTEVTVKSECGHSRLANMPGGRLVILLCVFAVSMAHKWRKFALNDSWDVELT